jgi:stringent starvation protein B|tara:strand:+ start:419 stop:832 length:414 start_codon:yes stop_codon:yes gene_type:complete
MLSQRPYLVPALYEWIVDNGWTPYILVNAGADGVDVPQPYVKDGRIVLNIAPSAVQALIVEKEYISFSARFGGTPIGLYVPMEAVMAVYAKENGQGMAFPEEEQEPTPPDQPSPPPSEGSGPADKPSKGKPSLKIVK